MHSPELQALSNMHWLRQLKGWMPELRDWWQRCNSSDVMVSTCLVLENKRHRGILRYTAAHQEQVLHCMPQRLWQDHPPSSAGSKHTEPTSPLLIFILVSFLQYFINQYFSETLCAHWIQRRMRLFSPFDTHLSHLYPHSYVYWAPPPPKELGDTSVWAFVKHCYPISQALTNSSSPPGDVQWAELLFYTKPLVPHENRWVTKLCCQWKGADLSLLKMYDGMWASPSLLTDREIGEWLCNLKKRK